MKGSCDKKVQASKELWKKVVCVWSQRFVDSNMQLLCMSSELLVSADIYLIRVTKHEAPTWEFVCMCVCVCLCMYVCVRIFMHCQLPFTSAADCVHVFALHLFLVHVDSKMCVSLSLAHICECVSERESEGESERMPAWCAGWLSCLEGG